MYNPMFSQFKKQLAQLDQWLALAGDHAKTKGFDSKVFLSLRLAPDQFAFVKQVQSTCDVAKQAAAFLSGKEAPAHPDTEETLEQLRARVQTVVAYLSTFSPADFAGADTRSVTTPRWEGKSMSGANYFFEHAIPNFYFHLTHSYAILRHNGVALGKKDYLGPRTFVPAKTA